MKDLKNKLEDFIEAEKNGEDIIPEPKKPIVKKKRKPGEIVEASKTIMVEGKELLLS